MSEQTLTIPAEAFEPKQLCGVRFCVIPEHWRPATYADLKALS